MGAPLSAIANLTPGPLYLPLELLAIAKTTRSSLSMRAAALRMMSVAVADEDGGDRLDVAQLKSSSNSAHLLARKLMASLANPSTPTGRTA